MKVIVHADDLGISRGISDRIVDTHRNGAVQRTSIVANGEAFDYAVERMRENPRLAWSVHLNLLRQKCAPSPQLIDCLVKKQAPPSFLSVSSLVFLSKEVLVPGTSSLSRSSKSFRSLISRNVFRFSIPRIITWCKTAVASNRANLCINCLIIPLMTYQPTYK